MRGIIRQARRPTGWRAPGPPPAHEQDRRHLRPRPGEDLCYLTGDWRIFQLLDGHRWSLDDLVTAWMAADEARLPPPRRALDLGCGIGAVLLMMAWRFSQARLLGIEAQAVSLDLARRSVAWNGVEARCVLRHGDLRDPDVLPDSGVFDLVTGTPPYLPQGTAVESRRVQVGPCHLEHRGGIEAYTLAATRAMAPQGRFVACAGALQVERVERAAASSGLRITRRLSVVPRAGKGTLFWVFVMRHANAAERERIDPPLVVRDERGRRTARLLALRRDMGMPP